LETADGEVRYVAETVDLWTPESLFERKWALAVIDAALARIRDEYKTKGREDRFDALYPLIAPAAIPPTHTEIADRIGCSVGAVKIAAHRLRAQLGVTLREEIASTIDSECDEMGDKAVDDELAILLSALRGE
jgi:RNA polymerase sigma-70 factor (ECF subfamily)